MSRAFDTIGVAGAGAFGTALAVAAARAGRAVRLWARDSGQVAAMRRKRIAPRLPGVTLPEAIVPSDALEDLRGVDALILAVPSQQLAAVATACAGRLPGALPAISAAKGIERASGLFSTQIIARHWPAAWPAILSGPSFAADIGRGLPTAVTLAAADEALARDLAGALSSAAFRIYHSADPRGVEIGGAAKNVLAIAAGIAIGLGYGESARAALVARAFAELRRLGAALGAEAETLMGLSGLGDLVLSCGSAQSRNFSFGQALGRGEVPERAAGGMLAEGVFTAPILAEMAAAAGVEMPIVAAVDAILAGRAEIGEAVRALLARPLRGEI